MSASESVFFSDRQKQTIKANSAVFCATKSDEKAKDKGADKKSDRKGSGTAALGTANQSKAAIADADSAAVRAAASKLVQQLLSAGEKSVDVWEAELGKKDASVKLVAESVLLLNARKQYGLGVEGLESAIRNDLIEPWIYDVLAFEMKLAGRPAEDIARVLDSRVDFAATELPQLMMSAALMSRFEAYDEAMVCCREAAKLNPSSEDVWLLARSVSDKSKNPEHQTWARCGILRHVWGSDHELQHDEAIKVLTDLTAQLDRDGKSPDAEKIRTDLAAAKAVDLRINLTWIGPADLDLIITEPGGRECSYRNRATVNGGRLIREEGVGDAKATSAKHTERYVCPVAPNGDYQLAVRFVLGTAVGGTAKLEVIENAGAPNEQRTTTSIKLDRKDVVSTVTLSTGRGK